jgi:hypothetical protein
VLGHHPRRERSDRPGIRYIEMMPADAHPCGDDFRSRVLQAVIVDVGECKMAAAPCERGRDRPPDP